MSNIRIIPRLDIKGPNVVKGIHLEGLRVIGRPNEMARHYYNDGADELFFMDVVASLYERNSLSDVISKTAKEIFIPLTVGGGLRTVKDMSQVLHAGADKVCFNTAAIKNPELISQAANSFGSSTIVIAIEAIKQSHGNYLAYTDNAREFTGVEVFEWAERVEALGAGEIVITSVDHEGTGDGYDIELVKRIANKAKIPVIAHGGAGKIQDVINVLTQANASAVAISSLMHYDYIKQNQTGAVNELEGNVEFIKQKRNFHKFVTTSIQELKNEMTKSKIPISQHIS
ncbi:imidazole glycerol phosphate synthase cyclase subunit [Verrucomicrobia bacterium]|nr:imidazole glycerol phosphate synthase cyclase subunit [Verrucomicrobiota bacterium]